MQEIENDLIKIEIVQDMVYAYFKGSSIELDGAKKMIEERLTLSEGKSYPCLVDTTLVKTITKDAREAFAKGDGIKNMTACALLIGSPVNRLLGNFFLSVSKPGVPTRLFTSKEDALVWLSTFKKEKVD
jgi:hypothetical protein